MTFEEWAEKYNPIKNPFNEIGEGEDKWVFLHYHYVEEHHLIKDYLGDYRIWTKVQGDNGSVIIISGQHNHNRLGYYITENPYIAGESIQVVIDPGFEDITFEDIQHLEQSIAVVEHLKLPKYEEVIKSLKRIATYFEYNV